MPTSFDPYHKWLGIPPREQPPNHYRLLGLDLFEDDAEVIEAAANKNLTYLREMSGGEELEAAERLLSEIIQARLCLLNGRRREEYDATLRNEHSANAAPPPPPQPPPPPPPSGIGRSTPPADSPVLNSGAPMIVTDAETPKKKTAARGGPRHADHRKRPSRWPIVAAAIAAVLGVWLTVVVAKMISSGNDNRLVPENNAHDGYGNDEKNQRSRRDSRGYGPERHLQHPPEPRHERTDSIGQPGERLQRPNQAYESYYEVPRDGNSFSEFEPARPTGDALPRDEPRREPERREPERRPMEMGIGKSAKSDSAESPATRYLPPLPGKPDVESPLDREPPSRAALEAENRDLPPIARAVNQLRWGFAEQKERKGPWRENPQGQWNRILNELNGSEFEVVLPIRKVEPIGRGRYRLHVDDPEFIERLKHGPRFAYEFFPVTINPNREVAERLGPGHRLRIHGRLKIRKGEFFESRDRFSVARISAPEGGTSFLIDVYDYKVNTNTGVQPGD